MAIRRLSQHAILTYDDIESIGPPSHSLNFPAPTIRRAFWTRGLVYDVRSDNMILSSHILRSTQGQSNNCIPEKAYWVRRKISETTHGCIRLCVVLVRQKREKITNILIPEEPDEFAGWSYKDNEIEYAQSKNKIIPEKKPDNIEWFWKVTEELVAVKMSSWTRYNKLKGKHSEDPIREVAAMQLVGNYHPHILGCIEAMHDEKYLYLLTPFCKNGDFYGNITEKISSDGCFQVDESETRFWFRQILLALLHLQKKGVCHNNICLENILVCGEKCKLIDLGLCLRLPYNDPNNEGYVTDVSADTPRRLMINKGQCGNNLQYLAPELMSKEGCFDGFSSDLWSVGIILYIMIIGHAPFKWAHESDKNFISLTSGELGLVLKQSNISISNEANDLLNKMFQREPRKRLTLAQVMTHPWVVREDITNADANVTIHNHNSKPWFSRTKFHSL